MTNKELKILKDLYDEGILTLKQCQKLHAEAVKWVKKRKEDGVIMDEVGWLMFFNITEKNLCVKEDKGVKNGF